MNTSTQLPLIDKLRNQMIDVLKEKKNDLFKCELSHDTMFYIYYGEKNMKSINIPFDFDIAQQLTRWFEPEGNFYYIEDRTLAEHFDIDIDNIENIEKKVLSNTSVIVEGKNINNNNRICNVDFIDFMNNPYTFKWTYKELRIHNVPCHREIRFKHYVQEVKKLSLLKQSVEQIKLII